MDRPFNKVLIPIDGSSYSMRVGEYGTHLAKAYGVKIVSLYVIDERTVNSVGHIGGKEPEKVRQNLRREGENCLHYVEELAEQEGVEFTGLIKEGKPHRVIVDLAEEEGVDLIIIGKVGQRGPRRILIGSVTERVLEATKCPVLVVRSE